MEGMKWLADRADSHEMMADAGSIPECSEYERETAMRLRSIARTLESFQRALQSIADNTCCNGCREAGLVAKQAIAGYPRIDPPSMGRMP